MKVSHKFADMTAITAELRPLAGISDLLQDTFFSHLACMRTRTPAHTRALTGCEIKVSHKFADMNGGLA